MDDDRTFMKINAETLLILTLILTLEILHSFGCRVKIIKFKINTVMIFFNKHEARN